MVARKIAEPLIFIIEKSDFLGDVTAVSFVDVVVGGLVLNGTVRYHFAFRTPQEFLAATAETTAVAVCRSIHWCHR
jgi:hypothetical protein